MYRTLPGQVAERITAEIEAGTWADKLPPERLLAESLQVSRTTIRKTLAKLKNDGLIQTLGRRGHRLTRKASTAAPAGTSVGLLLPGALENLRPFTTLWVDELRRLLIENNIKLKTLSGHRFFSRRPDQALHELVHQIPQCCWILAHSNQRIQQWFLDRGIPCIIAGSCHHGLALPSVDVDHFGVCRHAAGAMLRHGHRRMAFLNKESHRAGDFEAEAGFVDSVRRSTYPDAKPILMRHDGTVAGATRALTRLFDFSPPPTALLVNDPAFYLTTVTFLAQRALRVPHNVSLISRDDDVYLSHLLPSPARYTFSPKTFARRLLPLVLALSRGEPVTPRAHAIEAKFIPGASLASPPSADLTAGGSRTA
jgi:DNA-binding LacI/PurR family transcriptional regulator